MGLGCRWGDGGVHSKVGWGGRAHYSLIAMIQSHKGEMIKYDAQKKTGGGSTRNAKIIERVDS